MSLRPGGRSKLLLIAAGAAWASVWRQDVAEHGGDRGNQHTGSKIADLKTCLSAADPGVVVIHRWRQRL
jgi:hypothetical protein